MISDLETVTPEKLGEYVRQVPFEELLVEFGHHHPACASYREDVFNAGPSELKAMKEDAIINSTARGGIIDEDASMEPCQITLSLVPPLMCSVTSPISGSLLSC